MRLLWIPSTHAMHRTLLYLIFFVFGTFASAQNLPNDRAAAIRSSINASPTAAAGDWLNYADVYQHSPEAMADGPRRQNGEILQPEVYQLSRTLTQPSPDLPVDPIAYLSFLDEIDSSEHAVLTPHPVFAQSILRSLLQSVPTIEDERSTNCGLPDYCNSLLQRDLSFLSPNARSLLHSSIAAMLLDHECMTKSDSAKFRSLLAVDVHVSAAPFLACYHTAGAKHLNLWKDEQCAFAIAAITALQDEPSIHPLHLRDLMLELSHIRGAYIIHESRALVVRFLDSYEKHLSPTRHMDYRGRQLLQHCMERHPTTMEEAAGTFEKFLPHLAASERYNRAQNSGRYVPRMVNIPDQQLTILSRSAGNDDALTELVEKNRSLYDRRYDAVCPLIEGGYYQQALSLLPEPGEIFVWRQRYRYTKEMHWHLPRFLPLIEDAGHRLYVEAAIISAINRSNPRSPGGSEAVRLQEFVDRGFTLDSLATDRQKIDLLATFSFHPNIAATFAEEYPKFIDDYDFFGELCKTQQERPGDDSGVDILESYRKTWGESYTAMHGLGLAMQNGGYAVANRVIEKFHDEFIPSEKGEPSFQVRRGFAQLRFSSLRTVLASAAFSTPEQAQAGLHYYQTLLRCLAYRPRVHREYLPPAFAALELMHYTAYGNLDALDLWINDQDPEVAELYAELRETHPRWKMIVELQFRGYSRDAHKDVRVGMISQLYNRGGDISQLVSDPTCFGFRDALAHRVFNADDVPDIIATFESTTQQARFAIAAASYAIKHRGGAEKSGLLVTLANEYLGDNPDDETRTIFAICTAEIDAATGRKDEALRKLGTINVATLTPALQNKLDEARVRIEAS